MRIAKIELDSRALASFFMIGLIPGLCVPAVVWLSRALSGNPLDPDYWLGIASSYGVAVFAAVTLTIWLDEGIHKTTEVQMEEQKRTAAWLAAHDDPVFGPPRLSGGLRMDEVSGGSGGAGSYVTVFPKCPQPFPIKCVTVFYNQDGFTSRQRDCYLRIVTGFEDLWKDVYPEVNKAFKEAMHTHSDFPRNVFPDRLRIGRDHGGRPIGCMFSLEYAQDEYADVWTRGSEFAKAEFYM